MAVLCLILERVCLSRASTAAAASVHTWKKGVIMFGYDLASLTLKHNEVMQSVMNLKNSPFAIYKAQYFTSMVRCICPGGSWGPRCKVLGRSFSGSGWVWVRPLPLCLPSTISLRILTRQPNSLILYSGPLGSHRHQSYSSPTPMMTLQLSEGRPQLLVEGGLEAIKLEVTTVINDGQWHTFHIRFDYQVKYP